MKRQNMLPSYGLFFLVFSLAGTGAVNSQEVMGLAWCPGMPDCLEWLASGHTTFNIYRGDLGVLQETGLYTQDPSQPYADLVCGLGEPTAMDPFAPALGSAAFYLVTGGSGALEGSLGTDGDAAERPRTFQCGYAEDIAIELLWLTPSDPDQLDDVGTDLDLHFLHPNGDWQDVTWDCTPDNPDPDWGNPVEVRDDPSVLRSDADGAGPEVITLELRETVSYQVGVHYRDDLGFGTSFVTVRIFVGGLLVFEFSGRHLENDDFWHVAEIGASGEILLIDAVTNGFPP